MARFTQDQVDNLLKRGLKIIDATNNIISYDKPKEVKKATRSKYMAKKTEYNGHMYDSQKEANHARKLDIKFSRNEIKSWKRQVRMKIEVSGMHICDYICDFVVTGLNGQETYEDVKGYKKGQAYQMFSLKKKLIKAIYDIDIIEI